MFESLPFNFILVILVTVLIWNRKKILSKFPASDDGKIFFWFIVITCALNIIVSIGREMDRVGLF